MEQTKALNGLEPFLALTKSASSPRAAADLITRATSAPNTFIFAELLLAPQIQSLSSSSDYSSHLTLLKLFSYGTYTDYASTPNLPKLNEAQTLKLRQLSFLTLAKNPADLSYSNLQRALGLNNVRELENLVISSIYAGLITGTLDPYNQLVAVSSVSPLRDLPPKSVPAMLDTLDEWSSRCVSTLADLEKQIAGIKAEALKRHKEEREWEAHVEKLVEASKDKDPREKDEGSGKPMGGLLSGLGRRLGANSAAKRAGGAIDGDGNDDMDLDDEDEETFEERKGLRSAKKRGLSGLGFGK